MEETCRLSNYIRLALFEKDMRLVRQVEYYFSDENLPGDVFLYQKTMKKNWKAWVPIKVLQTFRKVKDLRFSDDDIRWALK